ncbi:hypothetical protein MUP37_06880 [Candidatus Bathyarchaeota archaeon]|nr:hypothetical protein [Candidatus Bathyarchaeota archaeon]
MLTILTFDDMQRFRRRTFRSGGWGQLTNLEHAFFRALTQYVQIRGKIANLKVIGILLDMIRRTEPGIRGAIVRLGMRRAIEFQHSCVRNSVFEWCPRLGSWLTDTRYIQYLGSISDLALDLSGHFLKTRCR